MIVSNSLDYLSQVTLTSVEPKDIFLSHCSQISVGELSQSQSAQVSGTGTRDEPLRTSAEEVKSNCMQISTKVRQGSKNKNRCSFAY